MNLKSSTIVIHLHSKFTIMIKNYKLEIKWALTFVVMSLLWMLFEKSLGLHSNLIQVHARYTNLFAIPAIIIYILAMLDKRNKYYNGVMNYRQGLISGLIITGSITLLSPLTQIITSYFIAPDFFSNAIEYAVNQSKMSQTEAESYYNLANYIKLAVIGAAIMGIITSALVAAFTRRKLR